MIRCPHCQSVFFKTLETRSPLSIEEGQHLIENASNTKNDTSNINETSVTMMYRKKCRRCKAEVYSQKTYPSKKSELITLNQWIDGTSPSSILADTGGAMRLYGSEYTHNIAKGADKTNRYLKHIQHLEQHDRRTKHPTPSPSQTPSKRHSQRNP